MPSLSVDSPDEASGSHFSCVGCGACCRGRFVPLTLKEAKTWLERGHQVAVLLEAFDETVWAPGAAQYEYNRLRSATVQCGDGTLRVTAILAANALPQCPNLQDDGHCSIYELRPLVCRIYPMEISPFIPLMPSAKDCPDESWQGGGLLASDRQVNQHILQSRQADQEDAHRKVLLCEMMGLNVAAWKGEGLAIFQPSVDSLSAAIEVLELSHAQRVSWRLKVQEQELANRLSSRGIALDDEARGGYIFHRL